ncbi:MAG: type II toxin-antitoxin system RelE/ParE family toxin [Selenomonadaceae bacterium]|nr:type II toxin-antitoxin system RelE/ParE family toxin [Selenomonadaceae bacterium]
MAVLRVLPPAAKFLKKLKDKKLKALYKDAIDSILANPSIGEDKQGDLAGVKGYDIYYCKINYELAYTVETVIDEETGETEIVVVIMAGTRENFYDELKRYWKRK